MHHFASMPSYLHKIGLDVGVDFVYPEMYMCAYMLLSVHSVLTPCDDCRTTARSYNQCYLFPVSYISGQGETLPCLETGEDCIQEGHLAIENVSRNSSWTKQEWENAS